MGVILQMVEFLYHQAISHHALGNLSEAVASYSACMAYNANPYDGETEEEKIYPFLSFYLREVALYMHHHLEEPVVNYSLDADLSPELKVRLLGPWEGEGTEDQLCRSTQLVHCGVNYPNKHTRTTQTTYIPEPYIGSFGTAGEPRQTTQ